VLLGAAGEPVVGVDGGEVGDASRNMRRQYSTGMSSFWANCPLAYWLRWRFQNPHSSTGLPSPSTPVGVE
jgi:hypothetical protein